MALQDLVPIELAFGEEAGDRPSSLISLIPSRRGSIAHNKQPKPRQYDIPTCQPTDYACLCSIAGSVDFQPGVNVCSLTRFAQPAGRATPNHTVPNPHATSMASPSLPNSSNIPGPANPSPPTPTSLPNPTAAESSSHSPALSPPVVSASSSRGDSSPSSSASLSNSAGTAEDGPTTRPSISPPTIPIMSGSLSTPSPLSPGAVSSVSPPPSSGPHHLNTGAIVGIVLGVLAVVLAGALAIFLLRRHARRSGRSKSARISVESSESRQRLEACSYSDSTSRPASSVLTFGSALTPGGPDYDYEPKREPGGHSPALLETRPSAGDASVHSLHEGLLGPPALFGPEVLSPPSELLALARTDFAMNLNGGGGGLRRSGSGLSRTTASSRDVQSVEAL